MDTTAPLHPDVAELAGLLGTWRGQGRGEYPTIDSFEYQEEVSFGHVGKPFLTYRQSTIRLDTGLPAHAEIGYLRGVGAGRLELVLAHPTGVAEIAEGTIEHLADPAGGLRLHLHSTQVARTTTAKRVDSLERRIDITGDTLHYDLSMAAVGEPHQHHLSATLHRQA